MKTVINSIRNKLLAAMLVLGLMAAPAVLVSYGDVYAGTTCTSAKECLNQGAGTAPTGATSLSGTITDITNVLLFLLGAVSVIMLVVGGFRYVTSNGNADQIKAAKNTIMYSVIGLVVAILAYAIVAFVVGAFTD